PRREPATSVLYTLSLHDALPIWPGELVRLAGCSLIDDEEQGGRDDGQGVGDQDGGNSTGIPNGNPDDGRSGGRNNGDQGDGRNRSEEHTSELQSRENLVCRLLLE